jgi:hypothetical protein
MRLQQYQPPPNKKDNQTYTPPIVDIDFFLFWFYYHWNMSSTAGEAAREDTVLGRIRQECVGLKAWTRTWSLELKLAARWKWREVDQRCWAVSIQRKRCR